MANPKILVIDDQLLNVRLLERALLRKDMDVHSATNGPEGIRLVRELKPDVILLDIIMPGMDGIEVCRQLKADEATRDIPVIFITARTAKEDKLAGFDVGAADYLIKPFELDETLARVQTQLRIINEHHENLRLARQLDQTRRQAAIMHLTEGIAHNLNNLLGVIMGYISLLKGNTGNPEKIVSNCDRMEAAVQRMTRIVHQLTVIGHFKSLQKSPTALKKVITGTIEACLERLLHNAWESYQPTEGAKPEGETPVTLQISKFSEDGTEQIEFLILDRGKGIDPEIREGIFEPFVTSSSTIGRGMGLTIARHSVNCLGGTITVEDRDGGGTVARVALPLEEESREENPQ